MTAEVRPAAAPRSGLRALPIRMWEGYGRVLDSGYPVPVNVLSLYRIALASYMLILNAVPDLGWIADYPKVFYDPAPGMPAMWRDFLPYWALVSLEVLLILAICAMLVGWRTPVASIAVTVIGYTANSAYFTFGKIDHTFMLWIVPGLLALSGWGRRYSVDAALARSSAESPPRQPRPLDPKRPDPTRPDPKRPDPTPDDTEMAPAWPIAAVGAFLALSFLTAALPKILRGWLSFETSAVRRHFLQLSFQLERDQLLAGWFRDFDFQPFWEALDWAGVGLEVALAVSLFWPLAQRWLVFSAWIFHLANLLLLNISFYGPLAVYPVFFLPLISPGLGAAVGRFLMAHWRPAVAAVPILAAMAFWGQGLWWTVTQDVIGLSPRMSDLTFFLTGFVVLILVGVKSRGFRRTIGTGLQG